MEEGEEEGVVSRGGKRQDGESLEREEGEIKNWRGMRLTEGGVEGGAIQSGRGMSAQTVEVEGGALQHCRGMSSQTL